MKILTKNNISYKNKLINILNIYKIYKKLIIFFILLMINIFLGLKIDFIIKIYFIKVYIFYNINLAKILIIYLLFIYFFITNIII